MARSPAKTSGRSVRRMMFCQRFLESVLGGQYIRLTPLLFHGPPFARNDALVATVEIWYNTVQGRLVIAHYTAATRVLQVTEGRKR